MRLLHVEINVENNSHDREERQKDKPHLPVFLPMIITSKETEKEGNTVQLFPVHPGILPVPLNSRILPEEVTEKHMVDLVIPEKIGVARIFFVHILVLRLGTVPAFQ